MLQLMIREPDDIVVFLLGQLLNDVETRALSNS